MSSRMVEKVVPVGRLRCEMVRAGSDGPRLVLFHGVTRNAFTFLPLIPSLACRWNLLGLTFRGHGRSERSDGEYKVIDYVRDAASFLLGQTGEPAVIYGHSLGAMVAAAVAVEVPEAVRAVILEDPPFDTMGRRIRSTALHSYFVGVQRLAGSRRSIAELARDVADLRFVDPSTGAATRVGDVRDAAAVRFTARCLRQLDPAVLTPIIEGAWLAEFNRDSIFRRIHCPTLLLQADPAVGGMLIDEDADAAESLIPDCTRVRFPGANHILHWSRTQEVADAVHAFLASLDDSVEGAIPSAGAAREERSAVR